MMSKAPRRNDPERRSRILQATLDMVVKHSISDITYRKIAAEAGVSLGSMTYYFAGIGSRAVQGVYPVCSLDVGQLSGTYTAGQQPR